MTVVTGLDFVAADLYFLLEREILAKMDEAKIVHVLAKCRCSRRYMETNCLAKASGRNG